MSEAATFESARSLGEGPKIAVIMGSPSDLEIMKHTGRALRDLGMEYGIDYEDRVVSAHRTPERMAEFAQSAEENGLEVVVAGAGGSSHLQGMIESFARHTMIETIGVVITSNPDVMNRSLGSCIGMPEGVPLSLAGQNQAGAYNAGMLAFKLLARGNPDMRQRYMKLRELLAEKADKADLRLQAAGADAYLAEEASKARAAAEY